MTNEKDTEQKSPAEERATIGTPAGEPPEMGRKRHGTTPMHPEVSEELTRMPKKSIEEDRLDEDFGSESEEIGPTGATVGTHVQGGIPRGGEFIGGTLSVPVKWHSGDYKG